VTGDEECDWSKLEIAPAPEGAAGDAAVFWSNKVHRGPGTSVGEERLVLFCSRLPTLSQSERRATPKASSETDYSFYDTHLEPKLRLSERAGRSLKRRRGAL
jgi:hypothetical protein